MQYYLLKTNDEKTMIYQWLSLDPQMGKKKGFLFAPLVVRTFGIAHIAKFSETLANFDEEKLVGALILTTQAVQHVLEQWTTGEFVKGTKQFSGDNYGNKEDIVVQLDPITKCKIHKKVVEYRTALYADTIEQKFTEKTWNALITEARKYVPKVTKTIRKQKGAKYQEVEVVEEPQTKFIVQSDSE
ncbi:hypothetical protein AX14_010480 [Amanita brunnescens Koide BX004]|nr:hypothetical protein AX14_010480 [Amanita brunnescens Koide BX004]